MKVSFSTHINDINSNNGYGYAGRNIIKSLKSLGAYSARGQNIPHIFFAQPQFFEFYPKQYKIAYTPWESSGLYQGWVDGFNDCDEVWTTSPLCAKWYQEAGVARPIYVFEHGLEDIWVPKKRNLHQKLKFLHIGEPAPRKGGQLAMEAFRAAFGNRDDVHLTIKAQGQSTVRVYDGLQYPRSILGVPDKVYRNVTVLTDDLSTEELYILYRMNHVMVYPSWGEGFGFIPLQALATGMPTICTSAWAPYAPHLGNLGLDSSEVSSPWPSIHPGNMVEPSFEHLVELYRYTADNYEMLSESYFEAAPGVIQKYDWNNLTKKALLRLETL